ncbi:hypothetical protein ACIHCV_38485 [Streptomyces sp. NPDC051956]|uniref:hypothetical protein n=1 Tax=Streptomyces sp. NPDC051956 TaxID=3365677 RepID=UPI0037D2F7B3
MAEFDQQFVSVPVPREHVTQVYAFLASLSGATVPSPSAPSDTSGADGDGGWPYREWSAGDLGDLAASQLASVQTVIGLLDVLAEQPGSKVGYTCLVERLGVERNQLRGSLAAFTRVVHKHYQRRNWPMSWEEGPGQSAEFKSEFFYTVTGDIAARWKEVRTQR